ncbi:hypothetical protein [Crenobacter intestini]|uniref:Uncharacterized protein n=1 Tax=Crenobacter intestini TaxID=2563443 RepID=A0A4T0UKL7_9NEIS|nr:hypothetical protein [Crenobacter intestini]TIC78956.1 hypothetical protein E5K04_14450 [Crenobacter intestini]
MAVNFSKDALSKVLQETARSKRLDTWLWFYLECRGANLDQGYFYASGMRDYMAARITSMPGMADEINGMLGINFLPREMLEWIGESERQCQWLVSFLSSHKSNLLTNPPVRLLNRDLVVAMIDMLGLDVLSKKTVVDLMRCAWVEHIKNDGALLWFKGDSEEDKCELASRWIMKNDGDGSAFQINPIRTHQELLMYFDRFKFSDDRKLLCLSAVKKSWSQKKYRGNLNGKKQHNFILTDKAINRLDKLAKKHDLKRVDVLEILLQMESEKNLYIAEKMKIFKGLEEL